MRSQEQQYWDLYTILKLLDTVSQLGSQADNLKLQKLTFLHELMAQSEGLRSAHYKFFRYNLGPYSKVLANDVKLLESSGFVTKTTRQLTKRGRFLLELLSDQVAESPGAVRALELVNRVSHDYGKMSSPRLVDRVYAMKVPVYDLGGRVEKIRNVAMFLDILDPLNTDLGEVQPFSPDSKELIEEEMSLDPTELEPSSASYKAAVQGALDRIRTDLE
jgi:uncharacterized protein YwgA